jgi:hypothetical protein
MDKRTTEQERLAKLRDQQIRARDPHARERKIQQKITSRRRKKIRKQSFVRDAAKDVGKKWKGLLIGALLGLLVMILLPIILDDEWTELVGFAAVPVLAILGFIFGASLDWRDNLKNLIK